jgi:tetratricopeptide (TPR) repeat protein
VQGFCLVVLGAYDEEQEHLAALLRSSETAPTVLVGARTYAAQVKAARGPLDEALRDATALLAFSSSTPRDGGGEVIPLGLLAKIQLRRGDLEAAEQHALDAIKTCSSCPRVRALALATLAEIRLAARRGADALTLSEQALAALQSIPEAYREGAYQPLIHAEALYATGDHARAREVIERARTELLARADKIGDPSYRRSFLENVPENARALARAREWLGEAGPPPA